VDIVINAVGMPFNGETVKTRSLGGSESAAYYLARGLAERGHRVTVFTTTDAEGEWDGVQYVNAGNLTAEAPLGERFTFYAVNTPHDVLICQRHPLAFHKDYASKVNVWQLHDLALHRTAGIAMGGLPRVDFVTAVSAFHARQVEGVLGLKPGDVHVVPNGVDLSLYEPIHATDYFGPETWGQFKLLYQSRPERGLDHLVRPGGIMDRLRDTSAHLYVCAYDNTTQAMAAAYEQLYTWARALPNVTLLGALAKPELARLQKACDLLCYPTAFEEVSCITAMEAMAARLPMLTSAHAALPETCTDSGTILLPLRDGCVDEDAFVKEIRALIADVEGDEPPTRLAGLIDAQAKASNRVSWDRAVEALEEQIEEQFAARHARPNRVVRHCIEHSDIGFLDWYTEHAKWDAYDPIFAYTICERRDMYRFIESPDKLLDHYEHFEGVNCERMEREGLDIHAEIEALQSTTRFRGIVSALAEVLAGRDEARVLEFGCAHGHIVLALAKLFPTVTFVGMDFMQRSVALATKYAQDLGLSNVTIMRGSLPELRSVESCDVVIAAEVLEHIYDYHGALESLRSVLLPGGSMIFTTPTGRWEWGGHEHFKHGREHLHHFEREDWCDILNEHPKHTIRCAPFAPEETGAIRGSWVVHVTPEPGKPFGRVDYKRKLATLAPRQTVSACLIAGNAEHTIAKCLSSVAGWVDEIVVAIDPICTDRTREQIEHVRKEFPWTPIRVIDGVRALEVGFAAARNKTIEEAVGDWVLWIDTDEECPQLHNAWRLLRPSVFNAFSCAQIHYSAQPPQVLTTDYPARLFRNHRGVQFYGLIHEHPEDAPGKSVTPCALVYDIQFLHGGYVDERTRQARYRRNLPLLLRDVQENPDRLLNKFLLLRDIAQGIGFERGADPAVLAERAMHGIALMHEMIGRDDIPLRMVLDGLQYYSVCTEALGVGFAAKVTWNTGKPPFDTLTTTGSFDGRFNDRATYLKLLQRIAEESTKHYESQYV